MTAEVGGAEAGAAHGTGSRPPRCNPDPQVSSAKKKNQEVTRLVWLTAFFCSASPVSLLVRTV